MKKKWYLYLVSFFHSEGVGSSEIWKDKKINSSQELANVTKAIRNATNFENIGITNFILICKEWR